MTPSARPTTFLLRSVPLFLALVVVVESLALGNNHNSNHNNNNNNNIDRRAAIHQAGAAAAALGTATTAGGLLIPGAGPLVAPAVAAVDTINPIATLNDGSKFPLASFGLQ